MTLNVFLKNPLLYCTSEQWPIALNLTQLFQWYYHKYFWQFSSSLYCECYFSVPNRNRDLVSSKILIPLTKVPEKVNPKENNLVEMTPPLRWNERTKQLFTDLVNSNPTQVKVQKIGGLSTYVWGLVNLNITSTPA